MFWSNICNQTNLGAEQGIEHPIISQSSRSGKSFWQYPQRNTVENIKTLWYTKEISRYNQDAIYTEFSSQGICNTELTNPFIISIYGWNMWILSFENIAKVRIYKQA